jgi:hypothetical protein
MATQNNATIAHWVAVAAVIYLVLGLTTISLGSEILGVLFCPPST